MSQPSDQHPTQPKAQHDFLVHVINMPSWHKAVLLLGVILAIGGTVGVLAAKAHPNPSTQVPIAPNKTSNTTPPGARGMVDSSNTPATADAASTAAQDQPSTFTRFSPHAMKIGASIVAGFVIGWLFRAFIKTMVLLALLLGAGVWALSHFGILNLSTVDTSSVQRHSSEAVTWAQEHLGQLKSLIIQHLPSTTGGTLGAFLGFRRR